MAYVLTDRTNAVVNVIAYDGTSKYEPPAGHADNFSRGVIGRSHHDIHVIRQPSEQGRQLHRLP